MRHLEAAVLGADWTEGIVLRYGWFYGPGSGIAPGGEVPELIRKRKFPVVGTAARCGPSSTSLTPWRRQSPRSSTAAAASRTSWTMTPTPVAEWLPALAQRLRAKRPIRVPRFVGRLFAGEAGVVMMTELRGAANAKAKRELQWRPAHPSWRQGFAAA
jgi:hypothetical protein